MYTPVVVPPVVGRTYHFGGIACVKHFNDDKLKTIENSISFIECSFSNTYRTVPEPKWFNIMGV